MTEGRVYGKVAIVTGGAGGIGAEICRVLTAQGATVVAADLARPRSTPAALPRTGGWTSPTSRPSSAPSKRSPGRVRADRHPGRRRSEPPARIMSGYVPQDAPETEETTYRKRRRTDTPWGRRGATPSNRWTPGSG
ncbi:SDR family NAD(P)-dependent oxidoreductase [Streptomyces sp. NPDC058239]|uniref:SDR family NAD(P)-dependent oxidoreductase n=1 Tax=unclassified Streptomyces TaxID=2593676 RepID=UPI00365D7351